MRTPFLLLLFGLLGIHSSIAAVPRIPRTNEVASYEWEPAYSPAKPLLRARGNALLSALDGGQQIQEIQKTASSEIPFDPVLPDCWLTVIRTNGSAYRIGFAAGKLIWLPEGLYEMKDLAIKGLARLQADFRREIVDAPKPLTYTVGVLDEGTLSSIAQVFYGDAAKWSKIYEANRNVIKNPNAIKPGMRLTIPKLQ